jgi:hypothetical protein
MQKINILSRFFIFNYTKAAVVKITAAAFINRYPTPSSSLFYKNQQSSI